MKRYSLVIIIVLSAYFQRRVSADIIAPPQPLSSSISHAETVVVARLTKFAPDPRYHDRGLEPHDLYEFGLTQPGIYTFALVQSLKGKCDPSFELPLPEITTRSFNDVRITISAGNIFLLLLRKGREGHLEVVDAQVPLIMLSNTRKSEDEANKANQDTNNVEAGVTDLVMASLTDPVLRQVNTYFLRDAIGLNVVRGLAPYIDDSNPWVKDNVLRGMAANQQVAAIPLIQEAVSRSYIQGSGGNGCVVALQNYKTNDAIPYLNPLLFGTPSGIRLNTIMALGELARSSHSNRQPLDSSSIPYLMIALHDPEQQNAVARSAYSILHQIIPALGTPKDDFYKNREAETKLLLDWWRDELRGKHPEVLKPGETPRVPRTMPNLKTLKAEDALAALNPLLFERKATTRRDALAALQTRADRSSVPYLLMATEDPEGDIAYSASTTLHRVLKIKSSSSSRTAWEAHREADAAPLYAWWRDELLGNHIDTPYWRQRRKSQADYEKKQAQQSAPKPEVQPQSAAAKPVTAKTK